MHILIVGRIQTLCFCLHCHSIHQNRKIGTKKVQHSAHLTEGWGGVKSYKYRGRREVRVTKFTRIFFCEQQREGSRFFVN